MRSVSGDVLAFICGLVASNTIIAWLTTCGFQNSFNHKPVFVIAGSTAGVFSLWLGVIFAMGRAQILPSL
jgi:hypothetical protein